MGGRPSATQPAASFVQPVGLGRPEAMAILRSFVGSSVAGFDSVAEKVKAAGWSRYHIDSGHDPMITHAEELGAILLEIGGKP